MKISRKNKELLVTIFVDWMRKDYADGRLWGRGGPDAVVYLNKARERINHLELQLSNPKPL